MTPLPKALTYYLQKNIATAATGGHPQLDEAIRVVSECLGRGGHTFEIGGASDATLSLVLESRGADGTFEIERVPKGLLKLIGDEEGLRCGLYTILQAVGIHWFAPQEEIVVPAAPLEIELGSLIGVHKPDFSYRGLHICAGDFHYDDTVASWMSFNRMNRKLTHLPEVKVLGERLNQLGLRPDTTVHAYDLIISDEKYFERNPEYFSLVGGKRITHRSGGQLCLSNLEMRKDFANELIELIRQNPQVGVYGFCPNDGYGHCECEHCLALDTASDRENNQINGRVADFVQEICAAVAREEPEAMLGHYSYSNFADFLSLLDTPPPNLVISYTQFHCQSHAIANPDCPENRQHAKRFEYIRGKVENVYIYDYYSHRWGGLPSPIWQAELEDFRYWKKWKVNGFMSEVNGVGSDSWRSFGPAYYLAARLLWSVSGDWQDIFAEMCVSKYGKAADLMLKGYYMRLQRAMADSPDCFLKRPREFVDFFTPAVQDDLEKTLKKAVELEPGNAFVSAERVLFEEWKANYAARLRYTNPTEIVAAPMGVGDEAPVLPIHLGSYSDQMPDLENNTLVRIWSDADNIRLEMVMLESNPKGIRVPGDFGAESFSRSDNIEVFFAAPDRPHICYHFMVAAGGRVMASECEGKRWNWSWPHNARVKAEIKEDRWVMVMELPKGDIGVTDKFGFTVVRNRFAGGQWQILGAPEGGAFFDTSKYITATDKK